MDTYVWIIIGTPLLFLFMRTAWDLFTGYRAYRRLLAKDDPVELPLAGDSHLVSGVH